jgi:hypothetical protein
VNDLEQSRLRLQAYVLYDALATRAATDPRAFRLARLAWRRYLRRESLLHLYRAA